MKRYDLFLKLPPQFLSPKPDPIEASMSEDPNGNWYRADEVKALLRECLRKINHDLPFLEAQALADEIQSILNEGEGE